MSLPVDLAHWGAALVPILALLLLLVVLHWKAPEAGPVGMAAGALVAMLVFRTPAETVAVAGAKGVWDAIFILYVVWPALLLYRIADRAGAFQALRRGLMRFSRNELFLVLAFGWVFASFLQGIAGFGAPIAVVAPLLVALGVRPIFAVAIPLIGHAWANMFGTLAVGWLATLRVIEIQDLTETAFQTSIMLAVFNVLAGVTIAWLHSRMPGVRLALPMIAIVAVVHGAGQILLALWNPILSTFLAATLALMALLPLARWSRYREAAEEIERRPAMKGGKRHDPEDADDDGASGMGFGLALLPYGVLTVVTVVALVVPPIERALETVEVGMAFPAVETGYGVEREAGDPESPFTPLTHPGTFLLVAAAVAWVVYRARGFYEREETGDRPGLWKQVGGDAVPASVAIIAFLVMSQLMDHSGQTEVLAQGIAEVAPPAMFAFLSTWIGVLGAFMTSSNTASNILFAPLQLEAAGGLGLAEPTIIGAQSAGGAIGNAIAPANVVLGTGTAGIVGEEGKVLRVTLPWAGVAAVVTGLLTLLLIAWR